MRPLNQRNGVTFCMTVSFSSRALAHVHRGVGAATQISTSLHSRQNVVRDIHPLRDKGRWVSVGASREADHEIQFRNPHENLAAVAARKKAADLAILIREFEGVPQPAVLLSPR